MNGKFIHSECRNKSDNRNSSSWQQSRYIKEIEYDRDRGQVIDIKFSKKRVSKIEEEQ